MASKISIKVTKDSEIHGEGIFLTVSLWSHNRPGLKANAQRGFSPSDPFEHMRKIAETSGGALAEHLNASYGERHDPSECARVALECFDKMVSDYKQTGRLQEQVVSS
jgi:hypothetical protein